MALDHQALSPVYLLLGFIVLPLWIAAGFADYLCHRAAKIAETSGWRESVLHLIQLLLVGLPAMAALFFRPNAGFFLLALPCILLHHVTAYIDVRYADATRKVRPREQMVHSVLEILPITAFLLLAVAGWPQLLALFHRDGSARFDLEPRLFSATYTAAILAAVFLLNVLPYGEELLRSLKTAAIKR